jgi:hypothetical protein
MYFRDLAMYIFVCACVFARYRLQRLVEARLRAVFCRARFTASGNGRGKMARAKHLARAGSAFYSAQI